MEGEGEWNEVLCEEKPFVQNDVCAMYLSVLDTRANKQLNQLMRYFDEFRIDQIYKIKYYIKALMRIQWLCR